MNSPENEKDGSESEVISALKAEIHDFILQRDKCVARIKELLFTENPSAGIIFSKEIFALQQDKLRLQVEVDCRRNKINRIRMFGQLEELDCLLKKSFVAGCSKTTVARRKKSSRPKRS